MCPHLKLKPTVSCLLDMPCKLVFITISSASCLIFRCLPLFFPPPSWPEHRVPVLPPFEWHPQEQRAGLLEGLAAEASSYVGWVLLFGWQPSRVHWGAGMLKAQLALD